MKKSLNYITALPDFIEMQRLSFSWFISQGLADELSNFSSILDFSGNIESLIFGQDYRLIKPMSTALEAKKDAKSYVAQLQLLIEIRDKTANIVLKRERISIVNLPLMTNSATFIINGCERIIVSQIIRSPGIYFEKNKKQKRRKRNAMILSTASPKLKPFAPIPWIKTKFPGRLSYITEYYEINSQLTNLFGALRLYKIICNTSNLQKKLNRIETFLKLAKKSKTLLQFLKQNLTKYSKFNALTNDALILSNFLAFPNLIQKYPQEFSIQKLLLFRNIKILNDLYLLKNFQFTKLIRKKHNINKLQTLFGLKNNLIYLRKIQFKNISENSDLQFLKFHSFLSEKEIGHLVKTWENYINLKPIILFSLSKKKFTYQDFSQYRDKYEETDFYKHKYETKDLYTAILIPEYGSWVRFVFNREKERDTLKHTLKNKFEDDISIQTDKLTKQPVIHILKEMGLTDLEICQNLQHSDFFYFTVPTLTNSIISQQPLLRFNSDSEIGNLYQSFSESLRIFDPNYYRLGQIGRYKINNRLNLKIPQHYQNIIYEDIFAIIDRLITLSISKSPSDDIDHLKNRRVRSVGELLQNLVRIGFQRLARKISSQVYKSDKKLNINLNTQLVVVTFKEFFGASQLSQYMDQTNPLSALTHKRRISGLGPGGFDRDRISFAVRDIHPSHYGRICPIETPEGQNVGLIASLTTCARVNQSGFLETPFWRVINGKVIKTSNPIYLTAELEDFYKIAPADTATNVNNYLLPKSIPVRYKQDFTTVEPFEVEFIAISNVQIVSAAASLIPFFEHDDANRALMGSNMQRQSVPLLLPQKPIVGTGLENQIAIDSGFTTPAINSGVVSYVSANKIIVTHPSEKTLVYNLQKYQRSNQETCINQRPFVWVGDKVESGQVLADGPGIDGGELALGQNVLIAYMPWHGYNFEDAILINERLVYEDIFTSIHIEKYEVEIAQTTEGVEKTTKNIPFRYQDSIEKLINR